MLIGDVPAPIGFFLGAGHGDIRVRLAAHGAKGSQGGVAVEVCAKDSWVNGILWRVASDVCCVVSRPAHQFGARLGDLRNEIGTTILKRCRQLVCIKRLSRPDRAGRQLRRCTCTDGRNRFADLVERGEFSFGIIEIDPREGGV